MDDLTRLEKMLQKRMGDFETDYREKQILGDVLELIDTIRNNPYIEPTNKLYIRLTPNYLPLIAEEIIMGWFVEVESDNYELAFELEKEFEEREEAVRYIAKLKENYNVEISEEETKSAP